ncbi:MAG: bestrophin family protein [Candidatus Eremiobacterota bacterium]
MLTSRAPVTRKVRLPVLGLAAYTLAVLYFERVVLHTDLVITVGVHTLLGAVMGILVVFRTNTAYDRWWEGRKVWGQLVNDSRNLAFKVQSLIGPPQGQKAEFGIWLAAFSPVLRDHLRGLADLQRLPERVPRPPQAPPHLPIYVVSLLFGQIREWLSRGWLDPVQTLYLDKHISGLMDACGACERIRNTPMVSSYLAYVKQVTLLYLMVLPWVFPNALWVLPTTCLIGYFLLGVEHIAEDIEDPFGLDEDDLPLDRLCETISQSVASILPAEEIQEVPGSKLPCRSS